MFYELITDRKINDVNELLELIQKIKDKVATEHEESLFYQGISRGAYNVSDLNRVAKVYMLLDYFLQRRLWKDLNFDVKIWESSEAQTTVFTIDDVELYLTNLNKLQTVFIQRERDILQDEWLDLDIANEIEEFLIKFYDCLMTQLSVQNHLSFKLGVKRFDRVYKNTWEDLSHFFATFGDIELSQLSFDELCYGKLVN
ncbi:MAG: hypothetical protein ATN36_06630 [Epulopiscium sp. Nele67-Bin005]|nr:MAG: hypothetical protein ATN36_06630 [Epulopiscium sp. Nele67-Bin005]